MYKKILLLVIFLSFIFCGCGKKQEKFTDDLDRILKQNKLVVGVRTDTMPFGKLITHEVDMLVATISITEPRERILDFSVPYYAAGQAMMLPAGSDIISLRELSGRKVIIVYGSTSERSIRTGIPNVNVIGYRTYDEAYNALKNGHADALIADDTLLYRYVLNDKNFKLLPKRYSKEYYAIAFRKDESSQRLQIRVNSILQSLQTSGRLNRLQEKWGIAN